MPIWVIRVYFSWYTMIYSNNECSGLRYILWGNDRFFIWGWWYYKKLGVVLVSYVDQDTRAALSKNKNSYLVLIGSDNNKYCFLYQPESYKHRWVIILGLSIHLEDLDGLFLNTHWSAYIFITLLLFFLSLLSYRLSFIQIPWQIEYRMIFKQEMCLIGGM